MLNIFRRKHTDPVTEPTDALEGGDSLTDIVIRSGLTAVEAEALLQPSGTTSDRPSLDMVRAARSVA
ncbi:hypothetical protein JCM17844_19840 [Iodidimonas gelatinilytica]|uniref:Uncharacterized protein n=1 Tax=Iodidimonas gelatinilytica TaxID=1236966 RepID=A0A5A7MR00_9PROT|nr:hypothetical protein [Iodidimonas gelatinilytica]GEQ98347.1 hypothetical protein JCM17844_19840 [Iodidimonas gelatinilytica]GER02074.1 hypothetical protein JCM17845_26970 [Iodidimonas gelatinilytica]